jgi:hypothetical protein
VQAKVLYEEQKISEELYNLSQDPHYVARVFNRCVIHDFFFGTTTIEANYNTQNSGVVVKVDEKRAIWIGTMSFRR